MNYIIKIEMAVTKTILAKSAIHNSRIKELGTKDDIKNYLISIKNKYGKKEK